MTVPIRIFSNYISIEKSRQLFPVISVPIIQVGPDLPVRSGAKFSMPGMMDTVLNLGLTDPIADSMVALTGDARFVYDASSASAPPAGSTGTGRGTAGKLRN